jgi:4-O-beta-D-mannosyl-D-glucose phosphorylase
MESFHRRLELIEKEHEELIIRKNRQVDAFYNGIFHRYENPVLTARHIPVHWRYDLNPETNPDLMERIGFNGVFNAGAMKWEGKYLMSLRVEGKDRKSFFAMADSPNGIDNFRFWDRPVTMPETDNPDTNVYDMRLISHEDGWIYGLFCTERRDQSAPKTYTSAAVAHCGIARTRNLVEWERLPDLKSKSQQRNVVLHPEFVDGKYALYTRPQEGFIETGSGGGIGFALIDSIEEAVVQEEKIMDPKIYHTVKEVKNGQGPAPIKTQEGWLHLAHGVRDTAAGLRYVLYLFMTSLDDPSMVIHKPAGYLIAPKGHERVGDVSNVVFSNGWILDDDNIVYIYYASSDTRMHVATTSLKKLIDYAKNTPEDGYRSFTSVENINRLIDKNLPFIQSGEIR